MAEFTTLDVRGVLVAIGSRFALRLGFVMALLSVLCGAQITSAATHHTSTIKLGGVFVTSGPASAIAQPILRGYKLAFTQVNDKGGVNGAQIDFITGDDGYDPSNTVPVLKALVESDHVLAITGVFGSDDSTAAVPYLRGKKVPFFDPIGGGAVVSGDSWVWQTEPSYSLEGRVVGHYLTKTMKLSKVAAIYQQGINEPEISSLKKYFKGSSHFLAAPYQATYTDEQLAPLIQEVRNFKPQLVLLLGTLIPTADFVKDSSADGFQPPKGWFANYPQGDPSWLALAGACNCLNGSHVSSYADLTGKNPVARAYAAAIKKYDPGQPNTNYGLYGYFNGTLAIRALKLAHANPTATSLQKVFDTKFRNYKSGFTGVLNWTPTYRYGVKQFKIYKINGSKFVPVTSWLSS